MRIRKSPVRTRSIAQSTMRKIAIKGARKNARDILRSFQGFQVKKGRSSEEYVNKKVMQTSVGRTLDMIKVFDRFKRAEVQINSQTLANAHATDHAKAMAITRIEKVLGETKAERFFSKLNQVHTENLIKTAEIYNEKIPLEYSRKLQQN